jgi:phosphoglycerate dehydrogenase-like enzyme
MKIGTKSGSILKRHQELGITEFSLIDLREETIACEMLIGGRINEEILSEHPNLKYNYVPYTGLNGLDLSLCKEREITVYNSHTHAVYVAEKAMALILSLLGKVVLYHNNLMRGDFSNRNNSNRIGWTSLFNKTIGIYGYGHIGVELAKMLQPFNPKIIAYDINQSYDVEYAKDLNELTEKSDIVVICVPSTPQTVGSIDKEVLTIMEDKFLINVGRGNVVNEEDIYNALRDLTLKGYGSDVWFTYPKEEDSMSFPSNYPIHELPNVVMTPHCAAFSEGSKNQVYDDLFANIIKIINGEELKHVNIDDYI